MTYLEVALLLAGLVLLVLGYRRDRRKILLVAAILLFFAGSIRPLASGFAKGWADGLAKTATTAGR